MADPRLAAALREIAAGYQRAAELLEQEQQEPAPEPARPAVLPSSDMIKAEAIRLSRLHGLPAGRKRGR